MEKVNSYKAIVKNIISNLAKPDSENDPVKNQLVIDEPNGHYVLFMNGWQDESRFYGCLVHIEVKENGHIWVHEDRTDQIVVDKLLEKGIPKSDIVIGFHAPIMRSDTEFAVA
jgi:hypothetical protein